MSSNSQFPIQPQDLKIYLDRANTVMDSVTWRPAKSLAVGEPGKDGAPTTDYSWRASKLGDKAVAETLSLLKTATAIANDQVLLPVTITRTLQSIRKGLTIGSHVSNEYLKSCGFEILMDINRKGQFTPEQRTQFADKKNTSAAVELLRQRRMWSGI